MRTENLLVEIGCEELPAKQQGLLAEALKALTAQFFKQQDLSFSHIQTFVGPRRLAVYVEKLITELPAKTELRRGPALTAAFDAEGNPTQAALGFARSNGVTIDALERLETEQGAWLVYQKTIPGQKVANKLPELFNKIIVGLPIAKRMRWSNMREEFLRPVHWLVVLFGSEIIPWQWAGLTANNVTYGHRFHHPDAIPLKSAGDYLPALKKAFVIAEFIERRTLIQKQIDLLATSMQAKAIISEELLNEVAGLVEWPKALMGKIDQDYLQLPREVLITVLQHHQKCFALENAENKLLPQFIFIANLISRDEQQVIHGNERVIRPRLFDAHFFYKQDQQITLENRIEKLKSISYSAKLGSLFDKAERLAKLCMKLAEDLGLNKIVAQRAGMLAKTDLTTDMVAEFPELQGIMGSYYASADGESKDIALALREQYLPRFSGDTIPESPFGVVLSLAEKIDSLAGIFSIKQIPTGDKDPFGLRRAAIGLIRIILEKKLSLNLIKHFRFAVSLFSHLSMTDNDQQQTVNALQEFTLERLRIWYQEKGISSDVFLAIKTCQAEDIEDFDRRIVAMQTFRTFPDAEALAAANKRVTNILSKVHASIKSDIDTQLLQLEPEKKLVKIFAEIEKKLQPLLAESAYLKILELLTSLRQPIDQFFDDVMVMIEEEKVRDNRLAILYKLRQLFLSVGDISLIQQNAS